MANNFKKSWIKIILFIAVSIYSMQSYGQDMLTATLANQQIHDFQRERIRSEYEQWKSEHGSPAETKTKTTASRNLSDFTFTKNNAVIKEVEAKIIANMKQKNATTGKNLEAALKRDNPYVGYMNLMKKLGLNAEENYADVFTAYMLGMWRIANKKDNNSSSAQIEAVRKQVIGTINVAGLNSKQRQEKAAYLIYDLIFANEPYESSRKTNNAQGLQNDSDLVYKRFLEQNNLDLRKTQIGKDGFSKDHSD